MRRRGFLQMLAGAVLAASIKPLDGFGLGQTELPAADQSFREWVLGIHEQLSHKGWVAFPQATGDWGVITHAALFEPGDTEPSMLVGIDFPARRVHAGDQVRVDFDDSDAAFVAGDNPIEVGLYGLTTDPGTGEITDREISGGGYSRARLIGEPPEVHDAGLQV